MKKKRDGQIVKETGGKRERERERETERVSYVDNIKRRRAAASKG